MADVQFGNDVVEGQHQGDEQENAGDHNANLWQDVLHDV